MKKIKLNKGKVALVDNEDYEKFKNITWFTVQFGRKKPSHRRKCYVVATLYSEGQRKRILLHREILNLNNTTMVVDHINGNPLDNRKQNLRI